MRPGRDKFASEQEHAKEGRLQEECDQTLVGEQRPDHIGGGVGVTAPVRPDLERHDDSRDDAHAERHRENLNPEAGNPKVDLSAGKEIEAFQDSDEGGEADREGRQQKMPTDDPSELDPG